MLDKLKKVTDSIDQKRPKVLDKVIKTEKKEEGSKPKIRSDYKYTSWQYFFTCDNCACEFGPVITLTPQKDGGINKLAGYYMHCPDCGRFTCKPRCWNYNVGKCLNCAPSKEIAMQRVYPKVRSEHKIPQWLFYYTCDICDKDYGPEKSMARQIDHGFKITQKHYRQCPNCGRYICRNQCWNYEKGSCTLCNPLTPPEFVVKGGQLKNEYYLVCSMCRDQLGPISEVDWEKVKKVAAGATKIALGMISPTFAISGSYDLVMGAKMGPSPTKKTQDVASEAKTDLAQCPSCNRWVCIAKCWDKTTGVCNNCSK
jgi:hypothetical protein